MPRLDISVPHTLAPAEAISRIRALVAKVRAEHGDRISDLQEDWNGNVGTLSGAAMGFAASGTVTVSPTDVALALNLPFAASFFKDRIEAAIRDKATELLA